MIDRMGSPNRIYYPIFAALLIISIYQDRKVLLYDVLNSNLSRAVDAVQQRCCLLAVRGSVGRSVGSVLGGSFSSYYSKWPTETMCNEIFQMKVTHRV